jgi:hypothetical protein
MVPREDESDRARTEQHLYIFPEAQRKANAAFG